MAGPNFPGAPARAENEVVVAARRRAAELRDELGPAHPEYASALNQVALLLLMQGDSQGAEPLLRETVKVRRVALGERHPDFATALSSLGGLVWARGDFDGAEPLLREASELRRDALGPDHPKTRMSEDSLRQLVAARSEWQADCLRQMRQSRFAPDLAAGTPSERAPDVDARVSSESPTEADLGDAFKALAIDLERAARDLVERGAPPSSTLLGDATRAAALFRASAEALALEARSVGVTAVAVADLEELERLRSECRGAEAAARNVRERALAVLRGVASLSCPSRPECVALEACRRQAVALAGALAGATRLGPNLQGLVVELAGGRHPLAATLGLARISGDADDDEWSALYEGVVAGFGPAFAALVARGRTVPSSAL